MFFYEKINFNFFDLSRKNKKHKPNIRSQILEAKYTVYYIITHFYVFVTHFLMTPNPDF